MLRKLARGALQTRPGSRGTLPTARSTGLPSFSALVLFAAFALTGTPPALAKTPPSQAASAPAAATITVLELPPEGRETYGLIHSGGPFPFDKDGVVFGNRERLLPPRARGYYREYTVVTPRARNRGARRIICGGAPRTPDRCFYTADHYASFREIVE